MERVFTSAASAWKLGGVGKYTVLTPSIYKENLNLEPQPLQEKHSLTISLDMAKHYQRGKHVVPMSPSCAYP